jgi:predicted Zn finger-like uncharacterized protein
LFVGLETMTAITQCPECATRFKVSDVQIQAHNGLVRCGRCHNVFNASEHLHDEEPSRQLSLLIGLDATNDTAGRDDAKAGTLTTAFSNPSAKYFLPPERLNALETQEQVVDELTDEVGKPSRTRRWFSVLTLLLLTMTLLAQAAYFFRVDLAARLPGLKPLLSRYCLLLDCTIALPHKASLMAIESSELESDPNHGNHVTLHVLLHNHAEYAQALPNLELTLTDTQDHAIARRVFLPIDYVKNETGESLGIAASRELDIQLHLDTLSLKPTGYRLFLFYPQHQSN